MGTVLTYVQSGAGMGIATDSVAAAAMLPGLVFVPLKPEHSVPLVMAWNPDEDSPPVRAFRALVQEWLEEGKLWNHTS
jgi:DNA-binding transcriptional LysR family regulator